MRRWRALGCIAFAAAALSACEAPAGTPLVGPAPPEAVALKARDLPGSLQACPGSGPIDGYLAALRTRDPDGYAQIRDAWDELKRSGADAAAITAYVSDPSACTGALGAGAGKGGASFVIRYRDEAGAVSAFKKGILSFPNPSPEQQTPGLTVGEGTGLGKNSWAFERSASGRAASVAFWQAGRFDVMLLTTDLGVDESRRAADAVNSRTR